MNNKLKPNFSEELVGFVIESYLTFISFPMSRFSIEPFTRLEEAEEGADVLLEDKRSNMIPFYMQFKRPEGYRSHVKRARIIKNRDTLGLNSSPHALFFELRKIAKTAQDYQHNLLLRLNNPPDSHAAYVCPLFLERKKYREAVHRAGCLNWQKEITTREKIPLHQNNPPTQLLDNVLHLPSHIAFPPHDKISTHKHKYSFSKSGDDLCFHSPERIETRPLDFLDFIRNVSEGFSDRQRHVTSENADKKLKNLIGKMDVDFRFKEMDEKIQDNPFYRWFEWGEYLHRNYNIHQYAMIFREWE